MALASGALIVSAVLELIDPATRTSPIWAVAAATLGEAVAFVNLYALVARKLGADSGGGLLVAITLDGVPENLALGVALIGAGPLQVAALSGSIFLSNLPRPPCCRRRQDCPARGLQRSTATAVTGDAVRDGFAGRATVRSQHLQRATGGALPGHRSLTGGCVD